MSALADDNSGDAVSSSLNLMRRLPPSRIAQNVSGLVSLTPRDADELLQRLDRKWWCGARTHLTFGGRFLSSLRSASGPGPPHLANSLNSRAPSFVLHRRTFGAVFCLLLRQAFPALRLQPRRRQLQIAVDQRVLPAARGWLQAFREAQKDGAGFQRSL